MFQHMPIKENIIKPQKNNRLLEIGRSRIGVIIDTLNSVYIVEMVECGANFWKITQVFLVILCNIFRIETSKRYRC